MASEIARFETSNTPQIRGKNNNQDQDEVQDQVQALTPSSRPPSPGCCLDDGPDLHRLKRAWREKQLDPVDVPLGEMPPWAGSVMRAVAEDMQILMGLRAAAGDDRPLPYALSMAVSAGAAKDKPAASRAINALVRAGVIDYAGSLPPRGTGSGTKMYRPPAAVAVRQPLRRAA